MSEVRQYKTESKRLLDLMINSIYTNKEIFLRELISNASDAIDKYNYLSLTNDKLDKTRDYQIFLEIDKDKKTLSITDNGIGMTKEELIDSLGTIAKSGSYEFLKKLDDKDKTEKEKIDIIGQFGVGFYSSYMVSSKVEVYTKSPFSEKGYMFSSTGTEDYTIDECENLPEGTKIVFPSEETLNSYSFWYKVKENEDLSLIALKFYGDILLGSLLGEYNCLDKEIQENDVLFIPSFNELMELNNACSSKVNKYVRKRNV